MLWTCSHTIFVCACVIPPSHAVGSRIYLRVQSACRICLPRVPPDYTTPSYPFFGLFLSFPTSSIYVIRYRLARVKEAISFVPRHGMPSLVLCQKRSATLPSLALICANSIVTTGNHKSEYIL